MSLRNKIAFAIYLVIILASFGWALVYMFAPEFMPYHQDIVNSAWQNIDDGTQLMLIILMKADAAGAIAVGLFATCLLKPFSNRERWVHIALPAILFIYYGLQLTCTIIAMLKSHAEPPWMSISALMGLALIAYFFSDPQ